MLECVQCPAMELEKDLEHRSGSEEPGLFTLEKSGLTYYNSLKGRCGQLVVSLFSQATSDKTRGHSSKLHQERLGHEEEVFHGRGG